MTIENLPVWIFPPNWGEDYTETHEWLTDILTSPTGQEQRRILRYYPRRFYEFQVALGGSARTLAHNLIGASGVLPWYLPLWHDTHVVQASVSAGDSTFSVQDTVNSELQVGGYVVLPGESVFDYEILEVQGLTATSITTTSPCGRDYDRGALLYPTIAARLIEQPQMPRRTDAVATSQVKFRAEVSLDPATDTFDASVAGSSYRGFTVLETLPDYSDSLDAEFVRMIVELDNKTSTPIEVDTAQRLFQSQQVSWVLQGRVQYSTLKRLLYAVRGRAGALWVPTFMSDFRPSRAIGTGDQSILVERSGLTDSGGPAPDRQDIRIALVDGSSLFRRVTSSALSGANELLQLDAPIGQNIGIRDVQQISFMSLMRQDQDSIDIGHKTDIEGASVVSSTFRSAPDDRNVTSAL
jgi:hypothetical protein